MFENRPHIKRLIDFRPRGGELFGVATEERFLDENDFFAKKRADLLVIATQDADHVRHAVKALREHSATSRRKSRSARA